MTLSLTTNMRKKFSGVPFPLPIDVATAGAAHSALNACTITQRLWISISSFRQNNWTWISAMNILTTVLFNKIGCFVTISFISFKSTLNKTFKIQSKEMCNLTKLCFSICLFLLRRLFFIPFHPSQISGQTELKFFWFLLVKWDLEQSEVSVYLFPKTGLGSCSLRQCGGDCCKFAMTIRINKTKWMTAAIPSSVSNFSLTGTDFKWLLLWLRNEDAVKPLATACRSHKFLFVRLDCPGRTTLCFIFICEYLQLPASLLSSLCNGALCVFCLVLWFPWL